MFEAALLLLVVFTDVCTDQSPELQMGAVFRAGLVEENLRPVLPQWYVTIDQHCPVPSGARQGYD